MKLFSDAERQIVGDFEVVNNVPCIASPHSWLAVNAISRKPLNAPIALVLESYLPSSFKILDSYF
jgi:hypothetical protein